MLLSAGKLGRTDRDFDTSADVDVDVYSGPLVEDVWDSDFLDLLLYERNLEIKRPIFL